MQIRPDLSSCHCSLLRNTPVRCEPLGSWRAPVRTVTAIIGNFGTPRSFNRHQAEQADRLRRVLGNAGDQEFRRLDRKDIPGGHVRPRHEGTATRTRSQHAEHQLLSCPGGGSLVDFVHSLGTADKKRQYLTGDLRNVDVMFDHSLAPPATHAKNRIAVWPNAPPRRPVFRRRCNCQASGRYLVGMNPFNIGLRHSGTSQLVTVPGSSQENRPSLESGLLKNGYR